MRSCVDCGEDISERSLQAKYCLQCKQVRSRDRTRTPEAKAYFRERNARPEEVAKRKAYKQSSDGRAANKRYRDKPENKERLRVYRRQWSKSPEQRTRHNRNQKRYQELHGRQRGYRKYIGQLISQQGEACPLCTKVLPKTLRYIHVDHIIPQWHGGTEAFENLQAVHAACNLRKGNDISHGVAPRLV